MCKCACVCLSMPVPVCASVCVSVCACCRSIHPSIHPCARVRQDLRLCETHEQISHVPFDARRRRTEAMIRGPDGRAFLVTKARDRRARTCTAWPRARDRRFHAYSRGTCRARARICVAGPARACR